MTRIPDYVHQQQMTARVVDGLSRIRDLQAQVSSGFRAQDYAGIAQDASRLLATEIEHGRARQYGSNITQAMQRLEASDASVSALFDVASDLRTMLVQATSDNSGSEVPVAENARNMLNVVVTQLNAKLNGRFLFSGTRTDTPPISEPVPDPLIVGIPDATYYQGDSTALSVRADDGVTIDYGITGDRLGFQAIVGALKAAIAGDETATPGLLETAIDLANQALRELSSYRTELGSNMKTLGAIQTRHEDFMVYAEGIISDVENVDVTLAITQLAQQQTTLEASYTVLARISQLNLTNYLK